MSFRFKTVLGIALIELVLLSILLWTGLRFMAGSAEAEFRQRTDATARAYSVAARDALIAAGMSAERVHREVFTTKQQGTATLAPQEITGN